MPWTACQKRENRAKVVKTTVKQAAPHAKTREQATQTEPPFLTKGATVHVRRPFARLCGAPPAERLKCDSWDAASLTWRRPAAKGTHVGKALWCNLPEEALELAGPEKVRGPRTKTDPSPKGP